MKSPHCSDGDERLKQRDENEPALMILGKHRGLKRLSARNAIRISARSQGLLGMPVLEALLFSQLGRIQIR
jgi:hypothetical protein